MGLGEKLSYARSLLITAALIFLYTGIMGSISVISSIIDSGAGFSTPAPGDGADDSVDIAS
jgi:hypothetical protein